MSQSEGEREEETQVEGVSQSEGGLFFGRTRGRMGARLFV